MIAQPSTKVNVFTAGDHFAGLDPGGMAGILEFLITRSGYTKAYEWECRIDKQKHCSAESRPIRVIGHKQYGVVLRIKPGVHATIDYQATLYIPQGSGYSATNLFEQLRANEKSVSRYIRQGDKKDKTGEETGEDMQVTPLVLTPPLPVATQQPKPEITPEWRPDFPNLRSIVKNLDKLYYVLTKIRETINTNFCRNKAQFVATVSHLCKWDVEGHHLVAISRMLSELVKHEYLIEVLGDRHKMLGYDLTDKANEFINRYSPSNSFAPTVKSKRIEKQPECEFNIPDLLINLKDKLRELADVANRISANNLEKTELEKKIKVINEENESLAKVLDKNKNCYEVLNKLGQIVMPLPMQGAKHE